jgi:hypothetical protein
MCYFHTKFGVHLIKATQKIKVSLKTYIYHNMTLTFDLDLEMVPSMKFPSFIDNYTRDVDIDARPVEEVNAEQK